VPRVKTAKPNGRPTKKTAEAIARILKVVRTGLPLKFAAQAGNIEAETLSQWRAKDLEFAQSLEQARLEAVEKRWKIIAKAAEDRVSANGEVRPGDWKAVAWQLERSFPSEFSRPEIQLGVQINSQTVNQTLVVTAEVATQIQSRAERADATIEKLFAARTAAHISPATGTNGEDIREVETSLVPGVITMPVGIPSAGWWSQFAKGDSSRAVAKDAAQWVVQTLARETLGSRAGSVSFDNDATVGEVLGALERVAGPAGWQRLLKKAERD
jgi:hypothetical protein